MLPCVCLTLTVRRYLTPPPPPTHTHTHTPLTSLRKRLTNFRAALQKEETLSRTLGR